MWGRGGWDVVQWDCTDGSLRGLGTQPLPCLFRLPVTAWAASAVRGLGLDGGCRTRSSVAS